MSSPIVGLPDTPSPSTMLMPSSPATADAVSVREAYVSFAVRVRIPFAEIPYTTSRSLKKFVTVIFDSAVPPSWKISSSASAIVVCVVSSEKSRSSVLPFFTRPLPARMSLDAENSTKLMLEPPAPPIVSGSGPCSTQPLLALVVPSSTNTYAPAVTSSSSSKSGARFSVVVVA